MSPIRRGSIQLAIVGSTILLVLCALGWGALGVIAVDESITLDAELGRYLNMLLIVSTISAVLVQLFARLVRAIRLADDGYAAGYRDGLDAAPISPAPVVARLVRSPR